MTLTDLVVGWQWNLPPSQLRLPDNVREFQLPAEFQPQGGIDHLRLPLTLTRLQFGSTCEWPCLAQWAKELHNLYVGMFDMPLHPLSFPSESALRYLHLGFWFDKPLTAVRWPTSLTHVILSARFAQPLQDGDLPRTLRVLDMSRCRR